MLQTDEKTKEIPSPDNIEILKTRLLLADRLFCAADKHLQDLATLSPEEVLEIVKTWHTAALVDSVLPGLSGTTLVAIAEILHERGQLCAERAKHA
jgi:hypothetical protein